MQDAWMEDAIDAFNRQWTDFHSSYGSIPVSENFRSVFKIFTLGSGEVGMTPEHFVPVFFFHMRVFASAIEFETIFLCKHVKIITFCLEFRR